MRTGTRPASMRIWSAGCATGAEPYSIAICLAENLYRLKDWSLEIVGTDISQETLADARRAKFKPRAIEAVPERQRKRFFKHDEPSDLWQLKNGPREMVEFQRHNLMTPMTGPPFDCIFIRNVLIYFDRESKEVVLGHLLRALTPGGFLVVGPSEGVYGMLDPLEKITPFLYRKPESSQSA